MRKRRIFPWIGQLQKSGARRQPIHDVPSECLTSESVSSPQPSSVHCAGTLGRRTLTRARLKQKRKNPNRVGMKCRGHATIGYRDLGSFTGLPQSSIGSRSSYLRADVRIFMAEMTVCSDTQRRNRLGTRNGAGRLVSTRQPD